MNKHCTKVYIDGEDVSTKLKVQFTTGFLAEEIWILRAMYDKFLLNSVKGNNILASDLVQLGYEKSETGENGKCMYGSFDGTNPFNTDKICAKLDSDNKKIIS